MKKLFKYYLISFLICFCACAYGGGVMGLHAITDRATGDVIIDCLIASVIGTFLFKCAAPYFADDAEQFDFEPIDGDDQDGFDSVEGDVIA